MNRSSLIHGLLLVVALVAAYFVWTREPTKSDDLIPILNIRAGLDQVVYDSPDLKVKIERKKDPQGTYYWVTEDRLEKQPLPLKDKKTEAEKPEPTKTRKLVQFKGNEATEKLIEDLAQLKAERLLGIVDEKKSKEFELTESKTTLTLVSGSSKRVFVLGSKTYGNLDHYIQDTSDKKVYVVKPNRLSDLQYAQYRLVDRELLSFKITDIDQINITANKKTKNIEQHNRRQQSDARWTDVNSEQSKDLYRNWASKLFKLRVLEYVQPKSEPQNLQEVMSATFPLGSKKLGTLKLYKSENIIPDQKKDSDAEYYAVSDHTKALVKLNRSLADEVAQDIEAVMKD